MNRSSPLPQSRESDLAPRVAAVRDDGPKAKNRGSQERGHDEYQPRMPVSLTARRGQSPSTRPASGSPGQSSVKAGGRPSSGGRGSGDPSPTGQPTSVRRGATAAGPAARARLRPVAAGTAGRSAPGGSMRWRRSAPWLTGRWRGRGNARHGLRRSLPMCGHDGSSRPSRIGPAFTGGRPRPGQGRRLGPFYPR